MKLKEFPKKAKHPARPRYSLRKDLGFWTVTMEGRKAIFKDEQGAYYVAYLLLHQPPEPIHGMALALKSNALYGMSRKGAVTTEVLDPATGKVLPVASGAIFQQRSLGLEEAETAWALRRKEQELEAVLVPKPKTRSPEPDWRDVSFTNGPRESPGRGEKGNPLPRGKKLFARFLPFVTRATAFVALYRVKSSDRKTKNEHSHHIRAKAWEFPFDFRRD